MLHVSSGIRTHDHSIRAVNALNIVYKTWLVEQKHTTCVKYLLNQRLYNNSAHVKSYIISAFYCSVPADRICRHFRHQIPSSGWYIYKERVPGIPSVYLL